MNPSLLTTSSLLPVWSLGLGYRRMKLGVSLYFARLLLSNSLRIKSSTLLDITNPSFVQNLLYFSHTF